MKTKQKPISIKATSHKFYHKILFYGVKVDFLRESHYHCLTLWYPQIKSTINQMKNYTMFQLWGSHTDKLIKDHLLHWMLNTYPLIHWLHFSLVENFLFLNVKAPSKLRNLDFGSHSKFSGGSMIFHTANLFWGPNFILFLWNNYIKNYITAIFHKFSSKLI